jgi:hypothetical protein
MSHHEINDASFEAYSKEYIYLHFKEARAEREAVKAERDNLRGEIETIRIWINSYKYGGHTTGAMVIDDMIEYLNGLDANPPECVRVKLPGCMGYPAGINETKERLAKGVADIGCGYDDAVLIIRLPRKETP